MPLQRKLLSIFLVGVANRRDAQQGQMIGRQTRIGIQQVKQALAEQPGAHQQHHCRRNLDYHKIPAKAPPPGPRCATTAFR